jgi:hypothetical protein
VAAVVAAVLMSVRRMVMRRLLVAALAVFMPSRSLPTLPVLLRR